MKRSHLGSLMAPKLWKNPLEITMLSRTKIVLTDRFGVDHSLLLMIIGVPDLEGLILDSHVCLRARVLITLESCQRNAFELKKSASESLVGSASKSSISRPFQLWRRCPCKVSDQWHAQKPTPRLACGASQPGRLLSADQGFLEAHTLKLAGKGQNWEFHRRSHGASL